MKAFQHEKEVSTDRVKKIFFLDRQTTLKLYSSQALGPNRPPIQWVSGAFIPGVKRLEHKTEHSPVTGAEVKNTWICKSLSPNGVMA
jgi:hypothetical protein